MNDRKVAVVTGAAGFIGSHMVDLLLDRGYAVRGIDNLATGRLRNVEHHQRDSNFSFEEIDVRKIQNPNSLFKGATLCFHFAGVGEIIPSIEKPLQYLSVNVLGTVNVLECARHAGIRKFVYAASSSCYGLATEVPTTENALIDLQYPYALSKFQGEEAVVHWSRVYGLPVNSIRIFNAFGPRSLTSGAYGAVFGVFLAQKLAGKPFTVVGDGKQSRDFLFVTDVARAFFAVAEKAENGTIFNLGAGNPQSVNRLVELLGGEVTFVPKRPGEPDCTWADTLRIRSQTGWKPEVSFEEGVQRMLSHIEGWRAAPVWDSSSISKATKTWFELFSSRTEHHGGA